MAGELVRSLCRFFEAEMMVIFGTHIEQLLAEYATDPEQWPKKDAVFCLVSSLAKRGQTAQQGATKTSELVDLQQFYGYGIPTSSSLLLFMI